MLLQPYSVAVHSESPFFTWMQFLCNLTGFIFMENYYLNVSHKQLDEHTPRILLSIIYRTLLNPISKHWLY